jgi:hypothetical protein
MLALHIALYAIIGTCFAFSVVELGLCAYVVSVYSGDRTESYYDFVTGNRVSETVHVNTPEILSFLIFSAVWSMLVSVAGLGLPSLLAGKGKATLKLNGVLGVILATLYGITWVFWLACFADIAANLNGATSYNNYLNAVIAFAVLLWYLSDLPNPADDTQLRLEPLLGSFLWPSSFCPSLHFAACSSPTGSATNLCATPM